MSTKQFKFVFSDIPNNDEGKDFVKQLRQFFNKERYTIRVRGQYLKDCFNWRHYQNGQPLTHSKCLRIYIKEKYNATRN